MHLHRELKTSSVVKMLLLLLISYTSYVSASSLTPEEIAQAISDVAPERYCGRKLTEAMRAYCAPGMRMLIQRQSNPVKKSRKLKKTNKILKFLNNFASIFSGPKHRVRL